MKTLILNGICKAVGLNGTTVRAHKLYIALKSKCTNYPAD